jgi:alpha-tubulin suppressor-like RCC1 family protein
MPSISRLGLLALSVATLTILNSCGRTGMGGSSGRASAGGRAISGGGLTSVGGWASSMGGQTDAAPQDAAGGTGGTTTGPSGDAAWLGSGGATTTGDAAWLGSDGATTSADSSAVRVVDVSAGSSLTCAALSDGSLRCWGNGLGYGPVPAVVSKISRAIAVSVGPDRGSSGLVSAHVCALIADGSVQCWGNNADGQATGTQSGDGTSPAAVAGITSAVAVSAGGQHTCALLKDGTVQCWGSNSNGELGNGTTGAPSPPTTVVGLRGAVQVSAGASHTCARLEDGTVQCWGLAPGLNSTPGDIGVSDVVDVGAGYQHSCVVFQDGSVDCWGCIYDNCCGLGFSCGERPGPAKDPNVSQAVAISTGYKHRCALLVDHSIQCWGNDGNGKLGIGASDWYADSGNVNSGLVVGVIQGVKVVVGYDRSCAIIADGSLQCWGAAAANGGTTSSGVPVPVTGL